MIQFMTTSQTPEIEYLGSTRSKTLDRVTQHLNCGLKQLSETCNVQGSLIDSIYFVPMHEAIKTHKLSYASPHSRQDMPPMHDAIKTHKLSHASPQPKLYSRRLPWKISRGPELEAIPRRKLEHLRVIP